MRLRRYRSDDLEEIVRLFYDTVNCVNIRDYTKDQVKVWSAGSKRLEKSDEWFMAMYTVVAVDEGIIVGYGNIGGSGYLDHLYVHKDRQGCGIGTAICDRLEETVTAGKITVHASVTSRSFFERRDYKVVREQQVWRDGVALTNFLMEKVFER